MFVDTAKVLVVARAVLTSPFLRSSGSQWSDRRRAANKTMSIQTHHVHSPLTRVPPVAVSVAIAPAEAGDALAGGALDAGLVLSKLVLGLAQLLLVVGANLAVLVLKLVERLADDVELVDLACHCRERCEREIRT